MNDMDYCVVKFKDGMYLTCRPRRTGPRRGMLEWVPTADIDEAYIQSYDFLNKNFSAEEEFEIVPLSEEVKK